MKHGLTIPVLFLVCAAPLLAQTPAAAPTSAPVPAVAPALASREALIAELERTQARFLESISGLTEAQWTFKAAPDRWSIAECAEHIAASEPFIRKMVADSLANTLPAEKAAMAHKDDVLKTALVDRSKKFKAPEPLIPTNRFGTPAAATEAFRTERAATIALAKGDADLRAQGADHFLLGPLDSYGWFLFLSGHSERHTLQIEEVKTADGYPK